MIMRKNAPWFPSNIEFIRRINGQSIEEVKRVVFEASYLVMGWVMFTSVRLLPPRRSEHRLVTTKYNPLGPGPLKILSASADPIFVFTDGGPRGISQDVPCKCGTGTVRRLNSPSHGC